MAKRTSETPATRFLKSRGVEFQERSYEYLAHGGTTEAARQLERDEHCIIKTLVMKDAMAVPLIVLMHGDRSVSTKNLAREIETKSVVPCDSAEAQRHTRYQVGGTSPFGLLKPIPIYVEASILELKSILINGGKRGYLLELDPAVLVDELSAQPVRCANSAS
ncbi:MAG: Cys-tRNA(Pro) deacylase [Glaciecola sp.]|jgi:Cys-tRNA(Pro) deacylase